MVRPIFHIGICVVAAVLAGCAHTNVQLSRTATISWSEQTKRVVLVEPDVKLGELEASGAVDWRTDWSQTGKQFIEADIRNSLRGHDVDLVDSGEISDPHAVQLVKLHDRLGTAINLHTIIGGNFKLPTKSDPLDYTLGPGVDVLRQKYGADYALFVTVRDTYTTTGRALLMIGAAAFHVALAGGQQVGFASLVDLKTGNVVWYNALASQSGDLRSEKPASDVVSQLVKGMPL